MKEPITLTLKPYRHDVTDKVFSALFYTDIETEGGVTEIPADSYQLVLSALELIRWEVYNEKERAALNDTIWLITSLRDKQKMREWKRGEGSVL